MKGDPTVLGRRSPEREVVSSVLAPGDPCSGDEALYTPGSFKNFQRWTGGMEEAEWAVADLRFHELAEAILQGEAPWDTPELPELAHRLGLDYPRKHDTRPPRVCDQVLPDELLSDIVEDLVPDYAVMTERITGDDRPLDAAVVSVLFFVPTTWDGRRPIDWWGEEETERELVQAARILDSSPPCLFADGVPLLPYAPRRVPEGPCPRGIYVGRPYRVGEEWAWSGVVPLTGEPDLGALRARLRLEHWQHRRLERRASWEDMLRARPEVLYRACLEMCR